MVFHEAGSPSTRLPSSAVPALLTKISTWPMRASISRNKSWISSSLVRSLLKAVSLPEFGGNSPFSFYTHKTTVKIFECIQFGSNDEAFPCNSKFLILYVPQVARDCAHSRPHWCQLRGGPPRSRTRSHRKTPSPELFFLSNDRDQTWCTVLLLPFRWKRR